MLPYVPSAAVRKLAKELELMAAEMVPFAAVASVFYYAIEALLQDSEQQFRLQERYSTLAALDGS